VLRCELVRALGVVVLLDVELTDGTSSSSFEKPLIDAGFVEEMEAGHGTHLLVNFVLHKAHQAFNITFIHHFSCGLSSKLCFSNDTARQSI
jgi:hypothetical protein